MDAIYNIKHWLLTVLVAPVFLLLSFSIAETGLMLNFIQLFFISVLVGLVLSMPSFLLYTVVFHIAIERIESVVVMKTVLNLTAITGILLTLYFFDQSIDLVVFIPYAGATLFCSWLIPLKRKPLPHAKQLTVYTEEKQDESIRPSDS